MTNFEPRLRLGFLALAAQLTFASLAAAQAAQADLRPACARLATQCRPR
jgi:hypothetical protein